ncbi:MAG: DUF4258 domain-containing protein [Candidatus Caldarchaeum sp.]|nr:DUF4258 domain-containing protein [Candidatus Caldarchaeum sp.]
MNNIVYTVHGLRRIEERKISRKTVENALANPDKKIQHQSITKAIKRINNKVIVVVYKIAENKPIVITAFISSKTEKYLAGEPMV